MAHVPHVYLSPPWPIGGVDDRIELPSDVRHHLEKVLRRTDGQVSYTDGTGTVGGGRIEHQWLVRGEERQIPPVHPGITVLAAPLHRTERMRTLVEKLAELGVAHLRWVRTAHTVGRPPTPTKAKSWAVSALEQSQGAHLLDVSETVDSLIDVADPAAIYVDAGGGPFDPEWVGGDATGAVTLVIGPEGGLAGDEIPEGASRLGLGDRILRSETAAVVACAVVLDRCRWA